MRGVICGGATSKGDGMVDGINMSLSLNSFPPKAKIGGGEQKKV
jgi:hypothetical protein